jgi:hypothetical protein
MRVYKDSHVKAGAAAAAAGAEGREGVMIFIEQDLCVRELISMSY